MANRPPFPGPSISIRHIATLDMRTLRPTTHSSYTIIVEFRPDGAVALACAALRTLVEGRRPILNILDRVSFGRFLLEFLRLDVSMVGGSILIRC